jgi:cytochrome P450
MLTLSYQAYQDVPQLSRVLAVINETLRLFPPVSLVSADFSWYFNVENGC